jgi:4-alpha-glucanotransferase
MHRPGVEWQQRSSGVLLHPTSLPSRFGIGDLGPCAERYLRWLSGAGVGWWQVLPLNPPGPGSSPYSATSAFAGNPGLISPEALLDEGLLLEEDISELLQLSGLADDTDDTDDTEVAGSADAERVDLVAVARLKQAMLERAFHRLRDGEAPAVEHRLAGFRKSHHGWLDDFALFTALKQSHDGAPWFEWPRDLALREPGALSEARLGLADEIAIVELGQLLFLEQLQALRRVAAGLGVRLLGDASIFVADDSADVWARPELFLLDSERRPTVVAGVPPDYFSATGQLWGNPIYDWDRMREEGYQWWIDRLRHGLTHVDALRIDHFRGFVASWAIPAGDEVATGGHWMPGPGRELFDALKEALGGLPLVAEDLGEITPDVVALREELGFPGMAILQFGFSPEPRSTFLPYNHTPDVVVYTGTHDNNTTRGWLDEDASPQERDLVLRYCGGGDESLHWQMIRLALGSVAWLAVVPHQDLAGLGSEARMNIPGVGEGNWSFRLTEADLDPEIQSHLAELVWTYGRGCPSISWRDARATGERRDGRA